MGSVALRNSYLLLLYDFGEEPGYGFQRGDLAQQNDRVCHRCVCVQCFVNYPFRGADETQDSSLSIFSWAYTYYSTTLEIKKEHGRRG